MAALQCTCMLLPDENREVLQSLLLFLSDMASHSHLNQVSDMASHFYPNQVSDMASHSHLNQVSDMASHSHLNQVSNMASHSQLNQASVRSDFFTSQGNFTRSCNPYIFDVSLRVAAVFDE